jgi:riboflavin kinase / FMN adenylyltransferase
MDVVQGVEGLRPEHGPIFAVIGVFDGIHRGHVYLLDHLVREADARSARPTVITFDHHPDEVLPGSAPPLLIDPEERLAMLAGAGVEVTVVQHFDEVVRHISYDAFIDMIRAGTRLAGLLMTPDAAFGYERRGTPEAVAALGADRGFDLVVLQPFALDGSPVRSSEIRAAIGRGDLEAAQRLLGRPVSLRGHQRDGTVSFGLPMALPPDGIYHCRIDGHIGTASVDGATVRLTNTGPDDHADGAVRLEFLA